MPSTLTDQIVAAAVTVLSASGIPAGWTVERSRRRPTEDSELPIALVRPKMESVTKAQGSKASPLVKRTLHLVIALRAVGIDADLDAMKSWVISSIMAAWRTAGSTLQVLVEEIEEVQHDWDPYGAEQAGEVSNYAEDDVTFAVTFQTNRFDPTKAN